MAPLLPAHGGHNMQCSATPQGSSCSTWMPGQAENAALSNAEISNFINNFLHQHNAEQQRLAESHEQIRNELQAAQAELRSLRGAIPPAVKTPPAVNTPTEAWTGSIANRSTSAGGTVNQSANATPMTVDEEVPPEELASPMTNPEMPGQADKTENETKENETKENESKVETIMKADPDDQALLTTVMQQKFAAEAAACAAAAEAASQAQAKAQAAATTAAQAAATAIQLLQAAEAGDEFFCLLLLLIF